MDLKLPYTQHFGASCEVVHSTNVNDHRTNLVIVAWTGRRRKKSQGDHDFRTVTSALAINHTNPGQVTRGKVEDEGSLGEIQAKGKYIPRT